jgi:hypothetical protein
MHHQKTAERFTVDLAISMILAMALLLALIVVTQGSPLVRFAAAPLILRRLTFQGRYSPFERFQFMNCA